MLSIAPETYEDRTIKYMGTPEYAALPEAKRTRILKDVLTYQIEQLYQLLLSIDESTRSYSDEKRSLQKVLKHIDENGLAGAEDIQCSLDKVNAALAQLEQANADAGLMIIKNTPMWSHSFNDDDICSVFNVSQEDMQGIRKDHGGDEDFVGHLLLHAWASEAVDLFGRAMMDAIQANPKGNKMLQEGLEQFMGSCDQPIRRYNVTFDKYGDVATAEPIKALLQRVK